MGWVCPGGYVEGKGGGLCQGGGYFPLGVDMFVGVGTHPFPDTWDLGYYRIRSTSGRYASYWNAFLFTILWNFLIFRDFQQDPIKDPQKGNPVKILLPGKHDRWS